MSGRPAVKSPFENLRPTIVREPSRTAISAEAEARLLDKPEPTPVVIAEKAAILEAKAKAKAQPAAEIPIFVPETSPFIQGSILKKKRRDRLLLVSFRMPQTLKERLEEAAKRHELNQTDIINEAIELNLQRYL